MEAVMLDVRTPALVAAFLLAACNFPEPEPPEGLFSCTSNSDCASDACLPTGVCAASAEVVYLKETGTGVACSRGAPCGAWDSAMAALSATRQVLRASGSLTVTGEVSNQSFTILGDASTAFRSRSGQDTFVIRGTAKVEIYDSDILNSARTAIFVDSPAATLRLTRCAVTGAGEEGVNARVGVVELAESRVTGSNRYGVLVGLGGDFRMTRSLVAANALGGVNVLYDGRARITTSFIVRNLTNGGIQIPKPGPGSDVSFNTIVDNIDAGAGVGDTGGIFCDNSAFTFRNNIIYRNRGGVGDQQTAGICMFDGSYLQAAAVSDTRLNFKGADDYHLTASSPAMVKDVAGVACAGLVDYDGEARPQGAACDLGADELKQ